MQSRLISYLVVQSSFYSSYVPSFHYVFSFLWKFKGFGKVSLLNFYCQHFLVPMDLSYIARGCTHWAASGAVRIATGAALPHPLLLQVLIIAVLTGLVQFPNQYTRTNASAVIRELFSQCGPVDNNNLW